MKFLLYTTSHGRVGSIQLNRPVYWLPVLLVVVSALLAAAWLGAGYGSLQTSTAGTGGDGVAQWELALAEQRQELAQARKQARDQLNALIARLGRMQAQVLRIEALGQHLAEVASLEQGEFDFDQPPAQGGPSEPPVEDALAYPDFMRALDELSLQINDRARQLGLLEMVVSQHDLSKSVLPTGRPIAKGWLSSYYGMRNDPFTGKRAMHKGIDYAGKMSSAIVATAAGVVTWASKRYGYGQLVEVNHGNGYSTRYGHCEKILVEVGERVEPGQEIALMGSSGRSTGPHVHYEVLQDGKQIDPLKYARASR